MTRIDTFCSIYRDLTKISSEDLGQIYTTDVTFIDPIDKHEGLAEVKAYFDQLLSRAQSCQFEIFNVAACEPNADEVSYVLTWQMNLTLDKPNKSIQLQGTTLLKENDSGFYYHRDYYDLGEMIYEHIPLLGTVVRAIKRRLAQ